MAEMTAITREELFLAKAAGDNVVTLQPITRQEMFLERIAQNSGGGSGGNSVQSDWNQTDSSAADFIKNKPFGDMPTGGDTLYWDGNTEGLLDWNDGNYKISDTIVTYDEVGDEALFYIKGYYDPATTLHKGDEMFFPGMDGLFVCGVFMFVSESALGVDLGDGIAFSEPGIYCATLGETEYSVTFPGYTGFPVTKKIEEKYLPGAVILYVDFEAYLYTTEDTSDTSKRMTVAELREIVLSSRRILVNPGFGGTACYHAVASDIGEYGQISVVMGTAEQAGIVNFYTAEYVPETTE